MNTILKIRKSKLPKWWIYFVVGMSIKLLESVGLNVIGFNPVESDAYEDKEHKITTRRTQ